MDPDMGSQTEWSEQEFGNRARGKSQGWGIEAGISRKTGVKQEGFNLATSQEFTYLLRQLLVPPSNLKLSERPNISSNRELCG